MVEHGEWAYGPGSPAWTKSHDQRCMAEPDQRSIIIVCKDERDWMNSETGNPYDEFNMCDKNMITTQNTQKFKNSFIVLDDMGDKFLSHIKNYFTEGRHKNIQMIVMCLKLAQINNISRMNCDTIYITTYNETELFQNFNTTFKCNHMFHEIINELNSTYYNCTDGMADELCYGKIKYNIKDTFIFIDRNRTLIYDARIDFLDLEAFSLKDKLESGEIKILIVYIKRLLNSSTDRNTINTDNYIFYFNKLLTSKGIKVQNDVLTKEKFAASCIKY